MATHDSAIAVAATNATGIAANADISLANLHQTVVLATVILVVLVGIAVGVVYLNIWSEHVIQKRSISISTSVLAVVLVQCCLNFATAHSSGTDAQSSLYDVVAASAILELLVSPGLIVMLLRHALATKIQSMQAKLFMSGIYTTSKRRHEKTVTLLLLLRKLCQEDVCMMAFGVQIALIILIIWATGGTSAISSVAYNASLNSPLYNASVFSVAMWFIFITQIVIADIILVYVFPRISSIACRDDLGIKTQLSWMTICINMRFMSLIMARMQSDTSTMVYVDGIVSSVISFSLIWLVMVWPAIIAVYTKYVYYVPVPKKMTSEVSPDSIQVAIDNGASTTDQDKDVSVDGAVTTQPDDAKPTKPEMKPNESTDTFGNVPFESPKPTEFYLASFNSAMNSSVSLRPSVTADVITLNTIVADTLKSNLFVRYLSQHHASECLLFLQAVSYLKSTVKSHTKSDQADNAIQVIVNTIAFEFCRRGSVFDLSSIWIDRGVAEICATRATHFAGRPVREAFTVFDEGVGVVRKLLVDKFLGQFVRGL